GFKSQYRVEQKADLSPVTQLDIAVEERIRALIEEKFPEHGIVGEELGNIREDSPYQWVIDPIDGTKAFIAGKTTFTTLIALLRHEKPVLGIIDQPVLKERWVGITGHASLYNKTPLPRLNNQKSLQAANISTTSTDYFTEEQAAKFAKLCEKAENCILGGDAYAYGLLASGNLDIVVDAGMKPYDFCALAPVIEGVGGIITDWAGKPLTLHSDGSVIAAASKKLYDEAFGLLLNK
ncbi:MAG TPA: inositol monophosphatase family protein, partial [Niastella sp.]|nr:inositol monophosphatase family protein [Niastella sp.]